MKQRPIGRRAAGPRAIDELDEVFAAVAKYFGLLSEPTRLKILHAICNDELSVSEIVAATGATQTNVSRHLALLRDDGVVSRRKDGNAVFYKVTDRVFADVCRTVCVHIAGGIEARAPLREDLLAFVQQH
jgi:DNA-binding transcriptional ArsR family regulator